MAVIVAGVSHVTAPIEVREKLAFRPQEAARELGLLRPIYQKTAAYGHFGREDRDFTWERTDKADALREAARVGSAASV